MSEEIAIKVEHVSKNFVLPHEKVNSVKGIVTSLAKGKVWKTKETQHALRDVSFEVKKGEFFGIVGRNGSGKSTLLKMLAGIYQPTKGKIHTEGKLVPFIELGVGFNPELTGRENVYLNGAMMGFSRKEVDAMYDDIVEFAELEQFMDQKLKNYSSGMQVRLAFSVAIKAETDILLVDEVLAVGDADFQRKCFDYFKKLKRDRKTVVFVSHDMDAVREYCDRAILLEKSTIVRKGSPDKVAQEYTKLFNVRDEKAFKKFGDTKEERWGDGYLQTRSLSTIISEDMITIKQEIKSERSIDAPIIGFRVRSAAGSSILGTNTKVENQAAISFKKNGTKTITWEFPNILSDGEYYVDPAILHSDSVTVSDWWDGAATFVIKKQRHLPYPIDSGFRVTIKE